MGEAGEKQSEIQQLIHQMSTDFPQGKVYCIPAHQACTMLARYAHMNYVSLFPSFWELKGLVLTASNNKLDQDHFIEQVARDLEQKKPDVILIDTNVSVGKLTVGRDYVSYFFQSPRFQQVWQHYHYVNTLNHIEIYSAYPKG